MNLKISFAILDCFLDAFFPSLLPSGVIEQSEDTFVAFTRNFLVKLRPHFTSNINPVGLPVEGAPSRSGDEERPLSVTNQSI